MPGDSEGNNCASEVTQILRLNNEQNLRTFNRKNPKGLYFSALLKSAAPSIPSGHGTGLS